MTILPRTQQAIAATSGGKLAFSDEVPLPTILPDMVLVKTVAVAINPVDSKMVGSFTTPGAIAGCDFAGIVLQIGAEVDKKLRVGDRVCGVVHGMNPACTSVGAFAQYVGATGDFLFKIPDSVPWEVAASWGSCVGTVGMALFLSLGLPGIPEHPSEAKEVKKGPYVLIYGGSTATGTMAIQLIKLAGLTPIATCSPRNFDLVKSYGAEKVFDYHLSSSASDIRAYTGNGLRYALDCIAETSTTAFCYAAIGRVAGKYTALEPYNETVAFERPRVKADWVLAPTLFGKKIEWTAPFNKEGNWELRTWGKRWYREAQKLFDAGLIRSHPVRVCEGGLGGVLHSLERLRKKEISGEKLVHRLSD